MASSKEYLEFILEQLSVLDDVSCTRRPAAHHAAYE